MRSKQEYSMGEKKWFQSKTIIAGVIAVVLGIYDAASAGLSAGCGTAEALCYHLPMVPTWVFSLLGAFGIYGRTVSNTVIK